MLKEKKVYYENNISNKYKKIRKIILIPIFETKVDNDSFRQYTVIYLL